eukprot:5067353-Alexandrium_andersonii.AAC.1
MQTATKRAPASAVALLGCTTELNSLALSPRGMGILTAMPASCSLTVRIHAASAPLDVRRPHNSKGTL